MDITLTRFIETFLLPPGLMIGLMLAGWLLAKRFDTAGRFLAFSGFALLWLASTPLVADFNIGLLEQAPALTEADLRPPRGQAIVVMSGGRIPAAPEYDGKDVLSPLALERVRYAARLHRLTGLPVLATGGSVFGGRAPEAELIRDSLQRDFGVPVRWLETRSRNSQENAVFSYALLAPQGITRIYLVTHAWHMPRSRRAFEQAGFVVIPAPTGYEHAFAREAPLLLQLLPSADALRTNTRFVHEVLGMAWYAVRY